MFLYQEQVALSSWSVRAGMGGISEEAERLQVTVPGPVGEGPAGLGTSCQGLRSETVRTQLCGKFHNPRAQAPAKL